MDRDVAEFEARARDYESGWLGRLHRRIADDVAEIVFALSPTPRRILDVGCGTGYLLRRLADGQLNAADLRGVDPSTAMIGIATVTNRKSQLAFSVGTAERLPWADSSFDLVLSVTSFDHWRDQARGLAECDRVLRRGGRVIVCDLFSPWLRPTLCGRRCGKARTRPRAAILLNAAGFGGLVWHRSSVPLINTVTATKLT